jgi:predicted peptidase
MKISGLALLLIHLSISAPAETGFVTRSVEVDGVSYAYQVFVPAGWNADTEWPVILFLHGAGQRGSDGRRQLEEGLPKRLREMPDFPAVVVMPQCRRGTWWGAPEMEAQVFGALDQTMKELNGDPERVTLTGLSMGGFATWAFGYKYPTRFAALAPVCGGVVSHAFPPPDWHPLARAPDDPYTETASHLTKVPVWAFHGDADPRIPVSESRKLTEALRAAGGDVRYTEYPGVLHNAWDRAYWEDELAAWLLSKRIGGEDR